MGDDADAVWVGSSRVKRVGASELHVPGVCFGAYAIGGWYWGEARADEEAIAALRAGISSGSVAIDTAPVYGFGRSERLVGEALRGAGSDGERVLVMTKVGLRWDDDRGAPGFSAADESGRGFVVRRNSRPDSVRIEVDRSLRRLGRERIDLVQVHARDVDTPIAETMGALDELRCAGKVRAIGVSNYSAAEIREARASLPDVPLAATQSPYSLLDRSIEQDILPLARSSGMGVLAYAPLDQGLLSGAVPAEREFPSSDGRHRRPSFQPVNRRRVNACLDGVVRPIAEDRGATITQVVLARTLAVPGITALLVGARSEDQARENAGAMNVALSREEIALIDKAFGEIRIVRQKPSRLRRMRDRWLSLKRASRSS